MSRTAAEPAPSVWHRDGSGCCGDEGGKLAVGEPFALAEGTTGCVGELDRQVDQVRFTANRTIVLGEEGEVVHRADQAAVLGPCPAAGAAAFDLDVDEGMRGAEGDQDLAELVGESDQHACCGRERHEGRQKRSGVSEQHHRSTPAD